MKLFLKDCVVGRCVFIWETYGSQRTALDVAPLWLCILNF